MPQVWMALFVSTAFAAQCNIEEAWSGQKQVVVPGCKGVGCNANGQDWDCAWCIFDINKCESAYKHVCKETKAARDAQSGASPSSCPDCGPLGFSCGDPSMKNIVELAEGFPALSTFVAAGGDWLIDWLSSPDPGDFPAPTDPALRPPGGMVTVFAPTNDAFAALPTGVLDSLMKPANKAQLVEILRHHVVNGAWYLKDFVEKAHGGSGVVQDVEGFLVEVDGIKINDAHIVTPDLMASNGVVHVVDGFIAACCDCSCWGSSYRSRWAQEGTHPDKAVCMSTQTFDEEKCCSKSDLLV